MKLDEDYEKLLIQKFVKEKLENGEFSDLDSLTDDIQEYLDDLELDKPQFDSSSYHVAEEEVSSVSKINNSFNDIYKDLKVLYSTINTLGLRSDNKKEKWKNNAIALEKDIINLESRIENLLLLTKETDGYFSYFVDNLTDSYWIDKEETTAFFNANQGLVSLGISNEIEEIQISYEDTIDLPPENILFKVTSSLVDTYIDEAAGSSYNGIFSKDGFWSAQITSPTSPLVAELWIKLGNTPIELTKIFIKLHTSSGFSSINITPLYSVDNYNYTQLPTNTYTQDVIDKCTFSFSKINAQYIKFLITKTNYDNPLNNIYEIGFENIFFFKEKYTTSTSQTFVSKPIFVNNIVTNEPLEFNKVLCEVCERVEEDTSINYYITVGNNSELPITSNTIWYPIAPINNLSRLAPNILSLGDVEEIEIGINEDLTLSWSDTADPALSFHLLSQVDSSIEDDTVTAIDTRYYLPSSKQKILNYQIKETDYTGSGTGNGISYDKDSIRLFRNVGEKGIISSSSEAVVRNTLRGWHYEDPYYSCVIEIKNPSGFSIDVGSNGMYVDNQFWKGLIKENILTGKTSTTSGLHIIKIHKDNWLEIPLNLTSLSDIKYYDSLYPYNQKLLIEGYNYSSSYNIGEEKIYKGVDLYAEYLLKITTIPDLIESLSEKDLLKFFAISKDAPNTHTGTNEQTTVFVVNVNENNPDFENEKFVLRFKLINQMYSYLRFRADLMTEDTDITPVLDSYKIKFG